MKKPLRSETLKEDFSKALKEGATELGLVLGREHLEVCWSYYLELLKWNQKKSLTSITAPKEVAVKHFLDSLSLSPLIGEGAEVLDVGTGAGFPGLALKVLRRDLKVILLEASFKKVAFLRHVVRLLGLERVEVVHDRAEELQGELGNCFEVVVSRALGPLGKVLSLCLPFVSEKGVLIAMKGPNWQKEGSYKGYCQAKLEKVIEYELPFHMGRRVLLVFRKA